VTTYSKSRNQVLVLLALGVLATGAPRQGLAAEPAANPGTMAFAPGGTIRMKLNKGRIDVVGVSEDRITVSWRSTSVDDERDVKVKLERSGAKEASVSVDGPSEHTRYRIEVPRRSEVGIRMRAGELDVSGIDGSLDVELLAGELDLRLAEPRRYRSVAASVLAGDLTARPWHADTSGLWRSFKFTGEGDYDLRARLLAGELRIRGE